VMSPRPTPKRPAGRSLPPAAGSEDLAADEQ
jgi:hypothetical protein